MTYTPKPGQMPPEWSFWGMSGGRGAGKSRAAFEYLNSYMSTSDGMRALIVVPTSDSIQYTVEHIQTINPRITWNPSKRRLEWDLINSETFRRQANATEALNRVHDLPLDNNVRIYAEKEYSEAAALAKRNTSSAFITTSDNPDSIRGIQSHLTIIDELESFAELNGSGWPSVESTLGAFECARLATRLGSNPQMIITHTPSIEPVDGVMYTAL